MNKLQEFNNGRQVSPLHPGEVLADILESLKITQTKFADSIGVSRKTVNEIVLGKQSITTDIAIRISLVLNTTPQLWLNLQQKIDIWNAIKLNKDKYDNLKGLYEISN